MAYLFAIISCLYACIEGVREAYYYHFANGYKKNIHWIYFIQRALFSVLVYANTSFFILMFFLLSFSFFHNGSYYFVRNKLNPEIYKKKFFDASTTSTAVMEFNFLERSVFFALGIAFLVLNIIYKN